MDIDTWFNAAQTLRAEDACCSRLSLEQWRHVAPYLVKLELRASEALIDRGSSPRAMHLLALGTLQTFTTDRGTGRRRVAILRAGVVVGECSLFGMAGALASVEAITACMVWSLPAPRLDEMAQRAPALAYEILRAAGALMQARLRAHLDAQPGMA